VARDLSSDLLSKTGKEFSGVKWICIRGQLDIAGMKFYEGLEDSIEFTEPVNNATVNQYIIDIQGSVSEEVDGVLVNGISANLAGNVFDLENILLNQGDNYIAAVGYRLNGEMKELVAISTVKVIMDIDSVNSVEAPLTKDAWVIYDPAGEIINEEGMLKLVTAEGTGFGIKSKENLNIRNKPVMSMNLRTSEPFIVYVRVADTEGAQYYLTYSPSGSTDNAVYKYFRLGAVNNGAWQLVARDLSSDLLSKTGKEFSGVKWICIRGQLDIAGITLEEAN
jgi:hypothetical protein